MQKSNAFNMLGTLSFSARIVRGQQALDRGLIKGECRHER
jgi:hypothetical protein